MLLSSKSVNLILQHLSLGLEQNRHVVVGKKHVVLGTPTLRRNVSAELSKQTDYNVVDSSHVADIINSEAIVNTASNTDPLVE